MISDNIKFLTISVKLIITIVVLTIVALSAAPIEAGWLFIHKAEFRGKLVDIETKVPVSGAIVVAVYRKRSVGVGAGTIPSVIEIREAITDGSGAFSIPPYTTLIQPLSWSVPVSFLIYKAGYACVREIDLEREFSGKELHDHAVVVPLYHLPMNYRTGGILEISRADSTVERKNNLPMPILDSEHDEEWYLRRQKNLVKAIRSERQSLYDKVPDGL